MSIYTQVDISNDTLVIHATGADLPSEFLLERLGEGLQLCREKRLKKVLLHRNEPVMPVAAELDYYKLCLLMARRELHDYRFALAVPRELDGDRIDSFVEMSQAIGVEVERFDNLPDAESWLGA